MITISTETLDQIILTRLNLDAHESLAAKATELPFSKGEYADYERTERVAWAKADEAVEWASVIQPPIKLADWDTPVFNALVEELKASREPRQLANKIQQLAVHCPKCKAKPAESCKTTAGVVTGTIHVQRKQLANGLIEYDPESDN